jgi:guanylate kinase
MSIYDVFLSYNHNDRSQVERLAQRLADEGFNPFFDRWHMRGGELWEETLEMALQASRACVVCIGSSGIGPWENEELRVAIERRVKDSSFRVIPIFLPNCTEAVKDRLPPFLRRHHAISFDGHIDDQEPLSRIVLALRTPAPIAHASRLLLAAPKRLICLSGPSSIGKDVLIHRLMSRARNEGYFCEYLRKYTTRAPRAGESVFAPFAYLSLDQFHEMVLAGRIGCHRFSYGNHYGIDATFSEGVVYGDLLFVTQRLYKEIAQLRGLAAQHRVEVFAVLLTGDRRSLMARTLHRSLAEEQRRRRTQQVVEDLDLLDTEINELKNLFDVVTYNGDSRAILETELELWEVLRRWLATRLAAADSAS